MLGWSKALGMAPKQLLHDISYENLLLMSCAAPDYSSKAERSGKGKEEEDEIINGNDPKAAAREEKGKTRTRVRK